MNQNGYIALLVTIVISSLLLISVTAVGAGAVLHRLNIASTEESIQATYLANSCAYYALTQLAYNSNYLGNENVALSGNSCTIEPIPPPTNGAVKFSVRAEINQHKSTNIIATDSQLAIVSWTEE